MPLQLFLGPTEVTSGSTVPIGLIQRDNFRMVWRKDNMMQMCIIYEHGDSGTYINYLVCNGADSYVGDTILVQEFPTPTRLTRYFAEVYNQVEYVQPDKIRRCGDLSKFISKYVKSLPRYQIAFNMV